jgi:hypothetical protein
VNRFHICTLQDLDHLPKATVRATYLSDKSLGSADVKLAVLRVLATEAQEPRDGVMPEARDRLPQLFETMKVGLDAEELDLVAVVRDPGVTNIAMNFVQMGLTRVLDSTVVAVAFVIRNRTGAFLEYFTRDVEQFVACSACFKESRGDVKRDYFFDHYGTDPSLEPGEFRLRGIAPSYQLQLKGPYAYSWQVAWTPAGDGLVRCRGCGKTFDLKSGKEGSL